jgi:hypothetical protein
LSREIPGADKDKKETGVDVNNRGSMVRESSRDAAPQTHVRVFATREVPLRHDSRERDQGEA